MKKDIYQTITDRIIADLEKGVRPWMKPWSTENAAGRISLPLRANGVPYRGINILMLWSQSIERGYSSPHWMTFKQAKELGAFVKKGEQAAQVVYASTLSRTETDEHTGEESERNIPFLKSYAVFNAEQVEGLPERFTQPLGTALEPVQRIERVEAFIRSTGADVRHGCELTKPITMPAKTVCRCRYSKRSTRLKAITPPLPTSSRTGRGTRRGWIGILGASVGAMKDMRPRS